MGPSLDSNFLESEKKRLKSIELKMRIWGILILSLITGTITLLETGHLKSYLYAFIYTVIYWNGNVTISYYVDKHIKIDQNFIKSLYWQGAGMIVFNAVATFLILLINPYCGLSLFWQEYLGSLRITAFVIVVYNSLFLFRLLQNSKQQYGALIRSKAELEFAALQNQLNPHFLFNSLNTLQNLIEESPGLANEFVGRLSACYRYILEKKGKDLVDLQDELDFAKSFVHLLEVRFGTEALRVNWPENSQAYFGKLPPLSLQILIENSVKHNIISDSKPLVLDIFFENHYIGVKNNLQLRRKKVASTGKGLDNVLKRYSLFTNNKPLILSHSGEFVVKLPILSFQVLQEFVG